MEKLTVFVGGPIQYASGDGHATFDRRLRAQIEATHDHLSRLGVRVLSAHLAERFGAGQVPTPSEVTHRDLTYMRQSDVYVAVLPLSDDGPYRTDGTHVELGWATALNVPVVILWDTEGAERYSFLVRGLAAAGLAVFVDISAFEADPGTLLQALRDLSVVPDRDDIPAGALA